MLLLQQTKQRSFICFQAWRWRKQSLQGELEFSTPSKISRSPRNVGRSWWWNVPRHGIFQLRMGKDWTGTVDGRNPAPVDMVHIPIIYKVSWFSCMLGGAGFLPSTVVSPNRSEWCEIKGIVHADHDGLTWWCLFDNFSRPCIIYKSEGRSVFQGTIASQLINLEMFFFMTSQSLMVFALWSPQKA